jgi:hypothetical protein
MCLDLLKQFCHEHRILAAGNTDGNMVALPDELILFTGFCKWREQLFMVFFANTVFCFGLSFAALFVG